MPRPQIHRILDEAQLEPTALNNKSDSNLLIRFSSQVLQILSHKNIYRRSLIKFYVTHEYENGYRYHNNDQYFQHHSQHLH